MEIATRSPTPAATPAPSPADAGGAPSDRALLGADFETFLTMLTVQMQNQDPLNPIDSSDFATQLATFSSVEQQVRTNDLLAALGAQMGAQGVAQLSGWVGMTARAEMPVVFDGSPVTITTEGAPHAETAALVVRDVAGNEVQRLPVDPARQDIDWAGVTETGAPLPAGTYHLSIESFVAGDRIATGPVYVHSRIVEARNENGTPELVMAGGQVVSPEAVVGLRAPA